MKIKFLVCIILFISEITFLCPVSYGEAFDQVLNDDMEYNLAGNSKVSFNTLDHGGWSNAGLEPDVTLIEESGNKYLQIRRPVGSDDSKSSYFGRNTPALSRNTRVSVKMRFYEKATNFFMYSNAINSGSLSVRMLYENGGLYTYNTQKTLRANLTQGVWYSFTMDVDYKNQNYNLSVTDGTNNIYTGTNLNFYHNISYSGAISLTAGAVDIDDLFIETTPFTIYSVMPDEPIAYPNNCTITDNGSTVTLKNNNSSFEINKTTARINDVRLGQSPNLVRTGGGYYLLNYTENSVPKALDLSGGTYQVVSNAPEYCEVKVSFKNPALLPFEMEMHFYIEKDTPGIYVYATKQNLSGVDNISIVQSRYSMEVDPELFDHYGTDEERKGRKLPYYNFFNVETIMDATLRMRGGEIYTKYNYAKYQYEDDCVGQYGNGYGVSLITPNHEYSGGGPFKQEIVMHDSILNWHLQSGHYGTQNVDISTGWNKIYGPALFYLNQGSDFDSMWIDANEKAEYEKTRWPYAFVTDTLYEKSERKNVRGKINITDGSSAAGAFVILSKPSTDFQLDNSNYHYYTQADENGRFVLSSVRTGSYRMTVFVTGVIGEFINDHIQIDADTDFGVIDWSPKLYGEKLWQIGIPDRTGGEYRNGDHYRYWGSWIQYPSDFPNDVDFKIGVDNEAVDWNFMHPAGYNIGLFSDWNYGFYFDTDAKKIKYNSQIAGVPSLSDIARWNPSKLAKWKIRFDSAKTYVGEATLTIAIAGSRYGSLNVSLNGTKIHSMNSFNYRNDSSVPRSAISGLYQEVIVKFDSSLIRNGENFIELSHTKAVYNADGVTTTGADQYSSTIYDCLRLEINENPGAVIAENSVKIEKIKIFDSFNYSVEISNLSKKNIGADLYVALFDTNSRLTRIKKYDVSLLAAAETSDIDISDFGEIPKEDYRLKMFIWSDKLSPISSAKDF